MDALIVDRVLAIDKALRPGGDEEKLLMKAKEIAEITAA